MTGRILLALAVLVPPASQLPAQERPDGSVVVYVARHAERADDGAPADMMAGDPPLSAAGHERARRLAELMTGAGITHIHSTDLIRTRSTALPVSESLGLEVDIYDAADPTALARRLKATPGVHVVVGHSNTNPALVQALGGAPGDPYEPLEYDRIHIVHILPDGSAGSAVFRYGRPAPGVS